MLSFQALNLYAIRALMDIIFSTLHYIERTGLILAEEKTPWSSLRGVQPVHSVSSFSSLIPMLSAISATRLSTGTSLAAMSLPSLLSDLLSYSLRASEYVTLSVVRWKSEISCSVSSLSPKDSARHR